MLRPQFRLFDGENLVMRYQAMLSEGRVPLKDILHRPDVYVWHSKLMESGHADVRRALYYTTAVGDDELIATITKEIQTNFHYTCYDGMRQWDGTVVGRVYKKPQRSTKSRAVDINIVIDAMRHVTNGSAGQIVIYSGDSDFLPLIKELMGLGANVSVHALSSGLSAAMETAGDQFYLLDDKLFCPRAEDLVEVPK